MYLLHACHLTVKHILIECPDFELSRQKYFNCNCLTKLFEKTSEANIMTYLKEIGLYIAGFNNLKYTRVYISKKLLFR